MSDEWPRLSESLPGEYSPCRCQSCGHTSTRDLLRWQEHDDADRPEPVAVVLCGECSDRLIEPHPRLYRQLARHEPFPGTMILCLDCGMREGVRCRSPLALSNGGPGIRFPGPDGVAHVDGVRNGRRFGEWRKLWSRDAQTCEGKTTTEGSEATR